MDPTQPYIVKQPKRLSWRVVLLCILALAVVLFIVSVSRNHGFRVTNTDPSTSNVATVSPMFTIYFSEALSTTGASVTASPNVIRSYTISGSDIAIKLNYPMSDGQKYTVTISVHSKTGAALTKKEITFKASLKASSKLTAQQQQQLLNDQDKYPAIDNDPLLLHLPYTTLDFGLTGDAVTVSKGKQVVEVIANIYMSQADMEAPNVPDPSIVAQRKQEVIDYITSLGVDPANYNITYQVQQPTGEASF